MQNKMKMIYFQSVQKGGGASKGTCFVSYPHIPVQWIIQVIDTLILNYIMKYFTILFRFSADTCGQDPMLPPPPPPPLFFFFYKHRLFFHINNILQLSMYHCMTYIQ